MGGGITLLKTYQQPIAHVGFFGTKTDLEILRMVNWLGVRLKLRLGNSNGLGTGLENKAMRTESTPHKNPSHFIAGCYRTTPNRATKYWTPTSAADQAVLPHTWRVTTLRATNLTPIILINQTNDLTNIYCN